MDEADKGRLMTMIGVSGCMFLLVLAQPGIFGCCLQLSLCVHMSNAVCLLLTGSCHAVLSNISSFYKDVGDSLMGFYQLLILGHFVHWHSIAEPGDIFAAVSTCLFVGLFVCQHHNFLMIKCRMMKWWVGSLYKNLSRVRIWGS